MHLSRETIITLGAKLTPGLEVICRLQSLLRDRNAQLEEVVDLVQVDPALTFAVIRLSNSVLYGTKDPCESLVEAIPRVGLSELQRIVGLAVARKTFQNDLNLCRISQVRLWENAVGTGILMSLFADQTGEDSGGAHATGLLRNIGKVVLNASIGAVRYPGVDCRPDVHAWEREVYGITAVEVSATLLRHWRFSPMTVEIMRSYLVSDSGSEHAVGIAQMHLACAVVAEWDRALPGEETCWENSPDLRDKAGLGESNWDALMERARSQFKKLIRLDQPVAA